MTNEKRKKKKKKGKRILLGNNGDLGLFIVFLKH